ncbi:MAG: class I SAM-dependent RNA methyltransferase [Bacteroidaceae bacterium]|nr:class I SAM-dependent RNA methyltransferase [Bacteroidaceae bacterium]
MSRKKKELPLLESVRIEAVAAEGKSLVRVNDLVVFVPFAVPGDVVDLQVTRKKHSYAEAEVVRMVSPSPDRTEPFCPHFGVCGGCKWQMLPYELQLAAKQQQVVDALKRIGKVELPECTPILGSKKTLEYRNKLEFGFANRRWLTKEQIRSGEQFERQESVGYHAGGTWDKILPIEECHLMDPVNDRLRLAVRDYAYSHGLTFFDAREHTGLLRGMMIRLGNDEHGSGSDESGAINGERGLMLLMQFCITTPEEQRQAEALMEHLHASFPEVTSLLYVNNTKFNDTFGDLPVHVFTGDDHIFLHMEGLRFKVGPKSFYQTNTEQAYELYSVAREMAYSPLPASPKAEEKDGTQLSSGSEVLPLTGDRREGLPLVYDLYTGTGTIANFVARGAREVIGIEYVPEAIEDAKVNSQINGITNTKFFAGDMKDILTEDFISEHGRPDIIITDPPRAGMHADVVDVILKAAPQRIVYVSCNPATQARDLALLDVDYKVEKVQPVDMFPHTQHVENVVLLTRKK